MSGGCEPAAVTQDKSRDSIHHDEDLLPRFTLKKQQQGLAAVAGQPQWQLDTTTTQAARGPLWRRLTQRPVAVVLLVLAIVLSGLSVCSPDKLRSLAPGYMIDHYAPPFLQGTASTTMKHDGHVMEEELVLEKQGKQQTEKGPAGGFPEHRRTRDAILRPRLIADLPAHYLPGFPVDSSATGNDGGDTDSSPEGGDRFSTTSTTAATNPRKPGHQNKPRVIVVGDVHGELEVLQNLLRKVGYTPRAQGGRDHVILAGDIVNKGPDSPGVLALAMREGFSGVRGNHDDKLLKLFEEHVGEYEAIEGAAGEKESETEEEDTESQEGEGSDADADDDEQRLVDGFDNIHLTEQVRLGADAHRGTKHNDNSGEKHKKKKNKEDKNKKKDKKDKKKKHRKHISHKDRAGLETIESCTPAQRRWLANLPLILRVGHIPYIAPAVAAAQDGTTPLSPRSARDSSEKEMPTPYGGELVVVHGGLVPGVPLEEQDPWAVLHMRTLLIKKKKEGKKDKHKKDKKKNKNKKHHKLSIEKAASPASDHSDEGDEDDNNDDDEELLDDVHPEADLDSLLAPVHDNDNAAISMTPLESREGKPWARVWDKFQHRAVPDPARRTTVVFGHDAKAGLQVGEYSFGLDTGCVAGGKLTAMVFYEDEDEDLEGKRDAVRGGVVKVAHRFVSVPCRAGVKYDL